MTSRHIVGRIGLVADHYMAAIDVAAFLPRKLAYLYRLWRDAAPSPPSEIRRCLEGLRRDGIVAVPNFLDTRTLEYMRQAVPEQSMFEESPEGDRALFYRDAHQIRELAPFFDSRFIEATAKAYVSASAVPLRRNIGLKVVHGDILCFEFFSHMDHWKRRLKAFLYLEDIGIDNGPMIYLKGSHRGLWRLPAEASIESGYRTDSRGYALPEDYYYGCFWPHERRRLAEEQGYQEAVCIGPAGTLVMFDGRGLHRATALHAGRRLILLDYWTHPGDRPPASSQHIVPNAATRRQRQQRSRA